MNREYKYFVFADVHGEFDALVEALRRNGYNEDNPKHILLSAGDNFDRGTKNVEVYKFLRRHNALCIFGNHEHFFYSYLIGQDDGLWNAEKNGMWWTLRNFSGIDIHPTKFSHILPVLRYRIGERFLDLSKWLGTMPDGYKIGDYIITHAGFSSIYGQPEKDSGWYPNNAAITPKFIKQYDGHTGRFKFIFGHWHSWRLREKFIGVEDKASHIFDYQNFIGIDSFSNITMRVNVYTIDTDHVAIPFTDSMSLEEIKKLK